jgi:hypothetical protein
MKNIHSERPTIHRDNILSALGWIQISYLCQHTSISVPQYLGEMKSGSSMVHKMSIPNKRIKCKYTLIW